MSFKTCRYLIRSDLYRIHGRVSTALLLRELLIGLGFKYLFWMRICGWLEGKSRWCWPLYVFARLMLFHCGVKFGIGIDHRVPIGPGLLIAHFGGIFINQNVTIGRNCNLSQNVTIGKTNRGKRTGSPTIGDNVYIAPGAKIFGGIRIGNNVAIGANCVVNQDVPNNAVIVGVPGRVVSYTGSEGYINLTDYDGKI